MINAMSKNSYSDNLKKVDPFGDLNIYGRIILKCMLKK
jgi:hypothetical protein